VTELADQLRETYVMPRRAIIGSIFARAVARREIEALHGTDLASDLISGAVWFRLLLGKRQLDREFKKHLIDAILRGVVRAPVQPTSGSRRPRRDSERRRGS
jgi:Tetracyclin repressor-like, C-terminal domain